MTRTVGVMPPDALAKRSRLFHALERVTASSFIPRGSGQWSGLDGAIVFGDVNLTQSPPVCCLRFPADADVDRSTTGRKVRFADAGVDPRVRGRTLFDRLLGRPGLRSEPGETALATVDGWPVWVRREIGGLRSYRVAYAPGELTEHDRLKDHLTGNHFLPVLTLVQFLRDLSQYDLWTPPPPRASFIVDDPNLHWPTYGYLDFNAVSAHAGQHGYHLGVATVPLDLVFARRDVVALFAAPSRLSLLVHGNDHMRAELARQPTEDAATRVAAQALRRVGSFERRYDLPVSHIMVPPHGAVSETMMRALRRTGFEAVVYNTGPVSPESDVSVANWHPADLDYGGGLPGLSRARFDTSVGELTLRAFLDQPLMLYGHHTDFSHGLEPLATAAARVSTLPEVRWCSAQAIARSNYFVRRDGSLLRVRLYSTRVEVPIPAGVDSLVVERASTSEVFECEAATADAGAESIPIRFEPDQVISVTPSRTVTLLAPPPDPVPVEVVPSPSPRLWPVARRVAVEGRDRLQPLLSRTSVSQTLRRYLM